jgi:peptidoglycan/LPS O-acetylase OafA/YrhL
MQRQQSLDSLRGALSLTVVCAHGWQIFVLPDVAGNWGALSAMTLVARFAVIAFFALSGYVIAASLTTNVRKHGTFHAERYVSARFFRVVPPLLTVIILTTATAAILRWMGANEVTIASAARHIYRTNPQGQLVALFSLGTQGDLTGAFLNGPLWSLVVEIRLYVIAGLVACIVCSRGWLPRATAAILLWLFISEVRQHLVMHGGLLLQSMAFACFLCGAIAYRFRNIRASVLLPLALLFAVIAVLRALQVSGDLSADLDTDPNMLAAQVALGVVSAIGIVLVARSASWPFFKHAGDYSYTLYIGHFPLLLAIYFVLATWLPWSLAHNNSLATAVLATTATWTVLSKLGRWMERPKSHRAFATRALLNALGALSHAVTAARAVFSGREGPRAELDTMATRW